MTTNDSPQNDVKTTDISSSYPINDVYVGVWGESGLPGKPALIIRMQGCPVGCKWCDSQETWSLDPDNWRHVSIEWQGKNDKYTHSTPMQIAAYCRYIIDNETDWSKSEGEQWVLITGGEPAQYDLYALVQQLHFRGFKVALETSGVFEVQRDLFDWLSVCPAIGVNDYMYPVIPAVMEQADELRFLISGKRSIQRMLTTLDTLNRKHGQIWAIQPIQGSKQAMKNAVEFATKNNCVLSVQIHDLIDIRHS